MSEKCKTCANWAYVGGGGECDELPRLLRRHKNYSMTTPADFGCSGHTPKVEKPITIPGGGEEGMTKHCETCVNRQFRQKSSDTFYACELLPRLLGMHHLRWIRVGKDFGCSSYTAGSSESTICEVWVHHGRPGSSVGVHERYANLSQDMQNAVVRFMGKPRDEQAGG